MLVSRRFSPVHKVLVLVLVLPSLVKTSLKIGKQTFHIFSLRDLRFLFSSRDFDVLWSQRIIGFVFR